MVKRMPVRPSKRGPLPPKLSTDTMPVPVVTLPGAATDTEPGPIPDLAEVVPETPPTDLVTALRSDPTPESDGESRAPVDLDTTPADASAKPASSAADPESLVPPFPLPAVGLALVALEPPEEPPESPFVVPTEAVTRPHAVPSDLVSAGATLQAFLLNEGLAAVAHWQSLAAARSPAEAVRLHVTEVQRAAEASITCMGRIANHLGRVVTTPSPDAEAASPVRPRKANA
ncbi:hypothetical protein ASF39_19605 [Methylobacterium sp. Leaf108]|nr:hypothetical protein ASF39_19605 [Methylobacterium sp. Leaf108]